MSYDNCNFWSEDIHTWSSQEGGWWCHKDFPLKHGHMWMLNRGRGVKPVMLRHSRIQKFWTENFNDLFTSNGINTLCFVFLIGTQCSTNVWWAFRMSFNSFQSWLTALNKSIPSLMFRWFLYWFMIFGLF